MLIDFPLIIYPLVIIGAFIILKKTGIWDNPIFTSVLILGCLSFITYELIKHYDTGYKPRFILLMSLLFLGSVNAFVRRILPHIRKK